jgi:hypothetical protein
VPWKLDVPNADRAWRCPLAPSRAEGSSAVAVREKYESEVRVLLLREGRWTRVVCQRGFHGIRCRDVGDVRKADGGPRVWDVDDATVVLGFDMEKKSL